MSRAMLSRVEPLEDRTAPAVVYALSANSLIPFDTSNPNAALAAVPLVGLNAGDTLVGIDVRPQNGLLYGLGYNSGAGTVQLYALSPRTGTATAVGTTGTFVAADGTTPVPIAGTNFGFDFNPTVDRIRVVNDASQDFRINPNTGAFVDGSAANPGLNMDGPINGPTTTADGAAYTNNAPNVTVTTLYTLDAVTDRLYIQNPPNSGTQTTPLPVTVGGVALDFSAANGFDIPFGVNVTTANAAATGTAFAALTVGGVTSLYAIELSTGAATNLGSISSGTSAVQGLAVFSSLGGTVPAIGLSADGTQLLRSTGGPVTPATITGVAAGDVLVGIDFRPATGQLFGLGVNSTTGNGTLYLLDPQTGAATNQGPVGAIVFVAADGTTPVPLPAASVGYGFDFNPTVDRIRVITGSGLNFRVNPNNGLPVDGNTGATGTQTDANINPAPGMGVTAAAYTNSFGQPLTTPPGPTTLYTLNSDSNTLSIQNPANGGTQTASVPVTVNGVALDFTAVNGFDIPAGVSVATANAAAAGQGFASLTVNGVTAVYAIDLTTGVATQVAAGQPVAGLTLGDSPTGAVAFQVATATAAEGGTATITLTRTGGAVGAVTVNVIVTGGNAIAGTDYNGVPATVTFADGQTTATLVVTLPNDSARDGNKTLILGLANPTNGAVFGASNTFTLTITDAAPNPNLVGVPQFAVGQDVGGGTATLYNPDQSVRYSVAPFGTFTGGVRTAVGDVNGDGVNDLIVGTGPGGVGRLRVLDGVTQAELFAAVPFEVAFTGGLFVAAGDVNGDGIDDIVVTPDQTGGPRVLVYLGGSFVQFASFFGIDDANFRGGARAAVSDVNGDGFGDIIISAGFGGGPRIALFSGASVGGGATPVKLLPDFFAFEPALRNGAFVAGGDVNGDGFADLIFGGGPGGGPRVQIVNGAGALAAGAVNLASNPGLVLANFFAGNQSNWGGIRVGAADLDGDKFSDVISGSGQGAGSQVTSYLGQNLQTGNTSTFFQFDAFPSFNGGVFVN